MSSESDRVAKSTNTAVWILVTVFVILPLLACLVPVLCCGGTGLMGLIGGATDGR